MNNLIKEIVKFNKEAGLLENGYDDFLESSFQVEEALEGFDLETLPNCIGGSPKEVSRQLCRDIKFIGTDVDRFDKAIDAIVFAVGSMTKLGLTPQQMTKGILAVNRANVQKLNMPVDEHGKKMKPADFVGPEVELQKILDERGS